MLTIACTTCGENVSYTRTDTSVHCPFCGATMAVNRSETVRSGKNQYTRETSVRRGHAHTPFGTFNTVPMVSEHVSFPSQPSLVMTPFGIMPIPSPPVISSNTFTVPDDNIPTITMSQFYPRSGFFFFG